MEVKTRWQGAVIQYRETPDDPVRTIKHDFTCDGDTSSDDIAIDELKYWWGARRTDPTLKVDFRVSPISQD